MRKLMADWATPRVSARSRSAPLRLHTPADLTRWLAARTSDEGGRRVRPGARAAPRGASRAEGEGRGGPHLERGLGAAAAALLLPSLRRQGHADVWWGERGSDQAPGRPVRRAGRARQEPRGADGAAAAGHGLRAARLGGALNPALSQALGLQDLPAVALVVEMPRQGDLSRHHRAAPAHRMVRIFCDSSEPALRSLTHCPSPSAGRI